jgi:hypothetical protein
MKPILLAVILFSGFYNLSAQADAENKLKLDMWTNASSAFRSTTVPEKWKNESAVVLAIEREYIGDFHTKFSGRLYVEKLNIHFRIKLLDKAAMVDFSDLSFNDKSIRTNMFGRASTYRMMGIKVIKPNGTEKEVDLSKAVKADATSDKELKIPIPNLELGDIIDYYIATKDESVQMPDFGDEMILEGKYPIVSNTIIFSIPHEYGLFSTTYNNAPDFKKTIVKNDEIYTLKSEMQEKGPDLLWNYEYRTAPQVRYKIDLAERKPDPKKTAERILGDFKFNISDIGFLEDFIKLNFKKEKDPKKITKELYYALRNPIYKKAYFNIEQGDPLNSSYTPNLFFFLMDKFLNSRKIEHEILLVPSRTYGPIPSVVSFSACDLVMKVNTVPPIYIARPSPFSLPDDIPYNLEGMEGVTNKNISSYKPIAVSTADQNLSSTTLTTALDVNDIAKLHVQRKVIAKGHMKAHHQYTMFTNYDYLKEYDQPKYQAESSHLMGGIIKDYNKEKAKFGQRLAQDYNERDTRIKAEIERSTETKVSDYKLTVKNIGMWDTAPDTEYTDEFNLENMTKKAGPNIILQLGKLIEKQTDVPEDQKTRTRDVYMDFPRTFLEEISFTIPEGFTVEGIENLKKKTESDAGGFVSNAEIAGNTLVVKTKKYYTKNTYSPADWPKITNFLAAAEDFYNAKLLLKKK